MIMLLMVNSGMVLFFFQAEDGIRVLYVTGVQSCAFFFQAEDGIRVLYVTGVQTCALPISHRQPWKRAASPGEPVKVWSGWMPKRPAAPEASSAPKPVAPLVCPTSGAPPATDRKSVV